VIIEGAFFPAVGFVFAAALIFGLAGAAAAGAAGVAGAALRPEAVLRLVRQEWPAQRRTRMPPMREVNRAL